MEVTAMILKILRDRTITLRTRWFSLSVLVRLLHCVTFQIKTLEKAKSTGHFATAASILHSAEMDKEEEGETAEESGGEGRREEDGSPQPGQSLLLDRGEPMM